MKHKMTMLEAQRELVPDNRLELRLYAPSPIDYRHYDPPRSSEAAALDPRGVLIIGDEEDIQTNKRVIIIQM